MFGANALVCKDEPRVAILLASHHNLAKKNNQISDIKEEAKEEDPWRNSFFRLCFKLQKTVIKILKTIFGNKGEFFFFFSRQRASDKLSFTNGYSPLLPVAH